MKSKTLAILTVLGLLVSFPLLAQSPETQDPAQEPNVEQQEGDSVQATVETEDGQASLSAEEQDGDTEVQANIQDEDTEVEADFDEESDDELPRTAGPLPLLLLLGGAAGGTAYGLRRLRK